MSLNFKLNINDTVTVALTEVGIEFLYKYYRNRGSEGLVKYHHKGGKIYKFQVWELMGIFGKTIESAHYFEDNMITMNLKDVQIT